VVTTGVAGWITVTLNDGRIGTVTRSSQVLSADDGQIVAFDWVEGLTGTMSGRVLDADGQPFPNARVDHLDGFTGTLVRSVLADANGGFAFDDIGPFLSTATATVRLRAIPDMFGSGYYFESVNGTDVRTYTAAGQALAGDVVVPYVWGTVSGVVTAAGGTLAETNPYVYVSLPDGSGYGFGQVDTVTGAYSATTLFPVAPFRLGVLAPGIARESLVQVVTLSRPDNRATADFSIPGPRVTVNGAIFADAAQTVPAIGAYAQFGVPQVVGGVVQDVYAHWTRAGASGGFSATLFAPEGRVRVRVERPDGTLVREQLYDPAAGVIDFGSVSLGVSAVLVTVRDASGQPISWASRTLTDSTATVRYPSGYDTDGAATFLQVPAGAFTVTATDPTLGTVSGGGTLATDTDIMSVTLQFQAAGITGTVVAADGTTPIAGRTFTVEATNDTTSATASVTTSDNTFAFGASLGTAGDTLTLRVLDEAARPIGNVQRVLGSSSEVIDVPVSVVKGVVRLGPDGEPTPNHTVVVSVDYYDAGGGYLGTATASVLTNAAGNYAAVALPCGGATVSVYDPNTNTTVWKSGTLACPAGVVVVDFTNDRVQGVVRYADGTAVPNPNVYVVQIDPSGNPQYYYPSSTDPDGNYSIHGLSQGAFTLYGNTATGLFTTVPGTLSGRSTTLDITMPDDMTVTGTVTRANGTAVAGAGVSLTSNASAVSTTTDASGLYAFHHVALTVFRVDAVEPGTSIRGTASGLATAPFGTAVADIVLPEPATLGGVVRRADGTLAAGAAVRVAVPVSGSQYSFNVSFTTDASGAYSGTVQPGTAKVTATMAGTTDASRVTLDIAPGGSATVDLTLGDYTTLPKTVTTGDGHSFNITCNYITGGSAGAGPLAFSYEGRTYINGYSAPCDSVAKVEALEGGDVQYVLGPATFSSSAWTRKIFVPATGRFVRFLDVLANTTGAASSVRLLTYGQYWGTDADVAITSGGGAAGVVQPWYIKWSVSGANPAAGHVTAGPGTSVPSVSYFSTGAMYHYWQVYNMLFSPGQTQIVMHFVTVQPDQASAQAVVYGLFNLTDPLALKGLSALERSQIVNFIVR
jgi:hypothetical protein